MKYVDDVALVTHLIDCIVVKNLVQPIAEDSLELNVTKTKTLCCTSSTQSIFLTHWFFKAGQLRKLSAFNVHKKKAQTVIIIITVHPY